MNAIRIALVVAFLLPAIIARAEQPADTGTVNAAPVLSSDPDPDSSSGTLQGDVLPTGNGLPALNKWAAIYYPLIVKIEFFIGALAATAGMAFGLMTWRLILLSKNQKTLF